MKLLSLILIFYSLMAHAQVEECDREAIYLLMDPTSSLLNIPQSCTDKEIIIAVPKKDENRLQAKLIENVGSTLITLSKKDLFSGNLYSRNSDCTYGGDFQFTNKAQVYGFVTVDNNIGIINVDHAQQFSLFRLNFKKLEILPIVGQHFILSTYKASQYSQMSFQPTNLGLAFRFNQKDRPATPIRLNIDGGLGIDDFKFEGSDGNLILTPRLNIKLAIPL